MCGGAEGRLGGVCRSDRWLGWWSRERLCRSVSCGSGLRGIQPFFLFPSYINLMNFLLLSAVRTVFFFIEFMVLSKLLFLMDWKIWVLAFPDWILHEPSCVSVCFWILPYLLVWFFGLSILSSFLDMECVAPPPCVDLFWFPFREENGGKEQ